MNINEQQKLVARSKVLQTDCFAAQVEGLVIYKMLIRAVEQRARKGENSGAPDVSHEYSALLACQAKQKGAIQELAALNDQVVAYLISIQGEIKAATDAWLRIRGSHPLQEGWGQTHQAWVDAQQLNTQSRKFADKAKSLLRQAEECKINSYVDNIGLLAEALGIKLPTA